MNHPQISQITQIFNEVFQETRRDAFHFPGFLSSFEKVSADKIKSAFICVNRRFLFFSATSARCGKKKRHDHGSPG